MFVIETQNQKTISQVTTLMAFIGVDYSSRHTIDLYSESVYH